MSGMLRSITWMQTRKIPPIRRASAEVSPMVPVVFPRNMDSRFTCSPAFAAASGVAPDTVSTRRGCRGGEIGHMAREGNQKEASSCKRRVHNVLAKTAEKLFLRRELQTHRRSPASKEAPAPACSWPAEAGYQCTAVGNRHRFLHSFFIQIFRQGTDCHRNRNQKSSALRPKFQIPTQAAGARARQDGKHDFVRRYLGPRVGEDDTCNNPFICKIPYFFFLFCQKHFTHRADLLRQRTSCRADKGTTATFTALHSAVFQELLFLTVLRKKKGGPEESDPTDGNTASAIDAGRWCQRRYFILRKAGQCRCCLGNRNIHCKQGSSHHRHRRR